MFTDFEEAVSSPVLSTSTSSGLGWSPLGMEDGERKESSDIHPLDLRPWDITVFINLYKVHGRLPMVRQTDERHSRLMGHCTSGGGVWWTVCWSIWHILMLQANIYVLKRKCESKVMTC